MTDNVVCMPGVELAALDSPNAELVAVLEALLQRARTGEFQSIAATGLTRSGERWSTHGGRVTDVFAMRGAIAWLEDEFSVRVMCPPRGGGPAA